MKVLFANKITEYINSLAIEEKTNILDAIKPLNEKTKQEILLLNETSILSQEEDPIIYAYNIGNAKYVIFGIKDKKTLVIVDIIKLIDNTIEFSALKPIDPYDDAKK